MQVSNIFCKAGTGLNLCNKQFNCSSKFPSDQYLLGADHTFPPLHLAGRAGSVPDLLFQPKSQHTECFERGQRLHPFPGKQQSQSKQFPLKTTYALISTINCSPAQPPQKVQRRWHIPTMWLKAFRCSKAGRLLKITYLIRFCSSRRSEGQESYRVFPTSARWSPVGGVAPQRAARHRMGHCLWALGLCCTSSEHGRLLCQALLCQSFGVRQGIIPACWRKLVPNKTSSCCCLKLQQESLWTT